MKNNWELQILLAGCYINPLLRETDFISDEVLCTEYRSKAYEHTCKLVHAIDIDRIGPDMLTRDEDSYATSSSPMNRSKFS